MKLTWKQYLCLCGQNTSFIFTKYVRNTKCLIRRQIIIYVIHKMNEKKYTYMKYIECIKIMFDVRTILMRYVSGIFRWFFSSFINVERVSFVAWTMLVGRPCALTFIRSLDISQICISCSFWPCAFVWFYFVFSSVICCHFNFPIHTYDTVANFLKSDISLTLSFHLYLLHHHDVDIFAHFAFQND